MRGCALHTHTASLALAPALKWGHVGGCAPGCAQCFFRGDLLQVFRPLSLALPTMSGRTSANRGISVCLQAAFLIPVSVCIYTATGGLKATFLSSYIHTVIIYVALCIFAFTVYATGPDLGSPKKVRGAPALTAASTRAGSASGPQVASFKVEAQELGTLQHCRLLCHRETCTLTA